MERTSEMKYAKTLGLGLLIAALALTGCSGKSDSPKDDKKDGGKKEDEHVHGNGPHGGVTFDLGKYHAELTVDHPKKEISIHFLKEAKDKKEKDWPSEAVAAKEFTPVTKETENKGGKGGAPTTIKALPKDAS